MSDLSLSPIYTQLSQKAQRPIAVALGLGLAASSFMLFANVGIATFGIMPAITTAGQRKKANLTSSQAVLLWSNMFRTAAPFMISNIALGTLSFSAAAHFSRALRPILYPAAASMALVGISTAVLIMPINKKLLAHADKLQISSSADLTVAQQSEVDDLLESWRSINVARIGLCAVSFTLGLGAVLLI